MVRLDSGNKVRTIYVPLAECFGLIESALRPYVGVVAEIANHRPILESILETYFYGRTLNQVDPINMLTELHLPSDIASQVIHRISNDVIASIQYGFQTIFPSRTYSFEFLANDLVIHEIESSYPRIVVDKIDELPEDEDSYIPERLRHR